MQFIEGVLGSVAGFMWGSFMMYMLVGAGIYFTIRTRFVQFRKFGKSIKVALKGIGVKNKSKGGMTSLQSMFTAIAGQVGTGNIAGPATAIMAGGPGAIFWMWVSAFLGMGTNFAEAVAAQKYRETLSDGTVIGGPAYYIKAAFKGNNVGKVLAGIFSVAVIIGFGMAAGLIQGNTVSTAFENSFSIPPLATAIALTVLLFIIVMGGAKRVGGFVEKVVPLMAGLFLLGALIIIAVNLNRLPESIGIIIKSAFNPQAAGGGFLGISVRQAMRYGVARGSFSNEAGIGTTPHAHAVAKVNHPVEQGFTAIIAVFIDSFVILTATALVILQTGVLSTGENGIVLTQAGFESLFGSGGEIFLSVCVFFFCFSTMVAAYYYGELNVMRLLGKRGIKFYMLLVALAVFSGALAPITVVWLTCDILNASMAVFNLIGLVGVGGVVFSLLKDYESREAEIDAMPACPSDRD